MELNSPSASSPANEADDDGPPNLLLDEEEDDDDCPNTPPVLERQDYYMENEDVDSEPEVEQKPLAPNRWIKFFSEFYLPEKLRRINPSKFVPHSRHLVLDLICVLCQRVCNETYAVSCYADHRFCKECIMPRYEAMKFCPRCGDILKQEPKADPPFDEIIEVLGFDKDLVNYVNCHPELEKDELTSSESDLEDSDSDTPSPRPSVPSRSASEELRDFARKCEDDLAAVKEKEKSGSDADDEDEPSAPYKKQDRLIRDEDCPPYKLLAIHQQNDEHGDMASTSLGIRNYLLNAGSNEKQTILIPEECIKIGQPRLYHRIPERWNIRNLKRPLQNMVYKTFWFNKDIDWPENKPHVAPLGMTESKMRDLKNSRKMKARVWKDQFLTKREKKISIHRYLTTELEEPMDLSEFASSADDDEPPIRFCPYKFKYPKGYRKPRWNWRHLYDDEGNVKEGVKTKYRDPKRRLKDQRKKIWKKRWGEPLMLVREASVKCCVPFDKMNRMYLGAPNKATVGHIRNYIYHKLSILKNLQMTCTMQRFAVSLHPVIWSGNGRNVQIIRCDELRMKEPTTIHMQTSTGVVPVPMQVPLTVPRSPVKSPPKQKSPIKSPTSEVNTPAEATKKSPSSIKRPQTGALAFAESKKKAVQSAAYREVKMKERENVVQKEPTVRDIALKSMHLGIRMPNPATMSKDSVAELQRKINSMPMPTPGKGDYQPRYQYKPRGPRGPRAVFALTKPKSVPEKLGELDNTLSPSNRSFPVLTAASTTGTSSASSSVAGLAIKTPLSRKTPTKLVLTTPLSNEQKTGTATQFPITTGLLSSDFMKTPLSPGYTPLSMAASKGTFRGGSQVLPNKPQMENFFNSTEGLPTSAHAKTTLMINMLRKDGLIHQQLRIAQGQANGSTAPKLVSMNNGPQAPSGIAGGMAPTIMLGAPSNGMQPQLIAYQTPNGNFPSTGMQAVPVTASLGGDRPVNIIPMSMTSGNGIQYMQISTDGQCIPLPASSLGGNIFAITPPKNAPTMGITNGTTFLKQMTTKDGEPYLQQVQPVIIPGPSYPVTPQPFTRGVGTGCRLQKHVNAYIMNYPHVHLDLNTKITDLRQQQNVKKGRRLILFYSVRDMKCEDVPDFPDPIPIPPFEKTKARRKRLVSRRSTQLDDRKSVGEPVEIKAEVKEEEEDDGSIV